MASVADLVQRAGYRLRAASADDSLLQQVFGEKELQELAAARPELIETARSYFPHLTSSTYERLAREPDTLQLEKDRCEREMQQLAVQNYGAFIGSAKVTQAVRQEVVDIQKHLDEMNETLEPMQSAIQEFQTCSAGLVTRRASLRNVSQQLGDLLDLLELPQLLDACIRNQMYEESLELLTYCGNMLQAHQARGENVPILSTLKEQVAVQRASLHSALVAQLATDIHLPACVRVIGFLRRARRQKEEELRAVFIEHRGSFVEKQKQQVELLRKSRGNIITALKNAADLLRTHVYDIGTQYQALFQQEDGPLVAWLGEQIAWLTGLLRCHVLPGHPPGTRAPEGIQASAGPGIATGVRIDAAALMMVLRQCANASTALKRLGGHFFPAVAGFFDLRMEHHVCEMLDVALLTFHAELGRYDWVPSTALTGGSSTSAAATASPTASGVVGSDAAPSIGCAPGWLHPQALELTRHRPLAVFTNDLVQVFNELRQCPLHGLRGPVVQRVVECLTNSVALLRQTRSSATQLLQAGTPKAAEFTRLCRHFADILVPLMASLLEAVFGTAKLDTAQLIESMSPDLIPPEAEFPLLAEGEEVAPPMAPAPVLPTPATVAAESATGPAVAEQLAAELSAPAQGAAESAGAAAEAAIGEVGAAQSAAAAPLPAPAGEVIQQPVSIAEPTGAADGLLPEAAAGISSGFAAEGAAASIRDAMGATATSEQISAPGPEQAVQEPAPLLSGADAFATGGYPAAAPLPVASTSTALGAEGGSSNA